MNLFFLKDCMDTQLKKNVAVGRGRTGCSNIWGSAIPFVRIRNVLWTKDQRRAYSSPCWAVAHSPPLFIFAGNSASVSLMVKRWDQPLGDRSMESGFSHQKVTSSAKHELPSWLVSAWDSAAGPSILAPSPSQAFRYRVLWECGRRPEGREEPSSGKAGVWRRRFRCWWS